MTEWQKKSQTEGATVLAPGDFPKGSPESRAAARFRPQGICETIAKWHREKQPQWRKTKSTQFQKAWDAGFPPDLWPAEEIAVQGKTVLRLKDGTPLDVD